MRKGRGDIVEALREAGVPQGKIYGIEVILQKNEKVNEQRQDNRNVLRN